jgi:hypothetical protein
MAPGGDRLLSDYNKAMIVGKKEVYPGRAPEAYLS